VAYSTILVEKRPEDKVGIITLNRPEVRNAINRQVLLDLQQALIEFTNDDEVKVIILTGGDKVFAAGADIAFMLERTAIEQFTRLSIWDIGFPYMENNPKPIIAAIAGYALGGGNELAMFCDLRIATESAKLGQAEINIGIMPGGGGASRLTRLVGLTKAKEMVLTGQMITSQEALAMGLINKVVPDDKLMEEAIKMARSISRHSSIALAIAKKALNTAANAADIYTAGAIENAMFSLTFATEDQDEGMKAFLEKRKPQFQGK
jgi:enoyl-CoA hydratase